MPELYHLLYTSFHISKYDLRNSKQSMYIEDMGKQRANDLDLRSCELSCCRSAVPLDYVQISVASGSGASSTHVTSNVAFTQPSSASTFLNIVNINPSMILTNSADMRLQVRATILV